MGGWVCGCVVQRGPRPSWEFLTCWGRSSWVLTVTGVQALSWSKVILMLATIVVCSLVPWGFWVSLCFPWWLMRLLVSRVDRRPAMPILFRVSGFLGLSDEVDLAYVTS